MHTPTTFALENMTDFIAFERLCCDLLSCYGNYSGIVPQGFWKDGGKDAIFIERNDDSVTHIIKKIVFHFSLRKDYKNKLWEDLKRVKNNQLEPNLVVFVTSQHFNDGEQKKLKEEAKNEYGWDLEIFDQEWLREPLETNFQILRKKYLGLDYDFTIFSELDDLLENKDRHPNRFDFEQGIFYRNKIIHKTIYDKLKKIGDV
jgi:hypothetical protein